QAIHASLINKKQLRNLTLLSSLEVLLSALGDVFLVQSKYQQALDVYKDRLKIAIQLGNLRNQAASLVNLSTIFLEQGEFAEARSLSKKALELFHRLREPTREALVWYQLGQIALKQA